MHKRIFFGFWIFLSFVAILVGINHYIPIVQKGYFAFIMDNTFGYQYIHKHIPYLYSKFPILVQSHALMGTLMILIWPIQFSKKMRRTNPSLHRNLGILFFICAIYVAITAFLIGLFAPFAKSFETMSTTMVVLVYIFCIYKSLSCLKNKKYKFHGHWNLRIVALSLGIISQRTLFAYESLIPHGLEINTIFVITALLGFFGNLILAEIGIRKLNL